MCIEDNTQVEEHRKRLFNLISITPNLIWQLLTKRPENILNVCPEEWKENGFPDNVWIGTSVENQQAANDRIPYLLQVPAVIHFLSCEPLLGAVDLLNVEANAFQLFGGLKELTERFCALDINGKQGFENSIDWVICGGESGNKSRPMHPDWSRSLLLQCRIANVPFFFKQWGEWVDFEQMPKELQANIKSGITNHHIENFDCGEVVYTLHKVGKKASGSLLDGLEFKEFPNG